MKSSKRRWAAWLLAAGLTPMAGASGQTFTVTSNYDSGAGSLRQAILDTIGYAGAATINFSITGSSTNLGSMLPIVTNPSGITINGNNNLINGGFSSNTTGDQVFFVGVADNTPAGLVLLNGLSDYAYGFVNYRRFGRRRA